MNRDHQRFAAIITALVVVPAALWLLLFIGPRLLNAHRDDAAVLAVLVYLGVPVGLAWGGARLRSLLDPKDHDNGLS